MKFQVLLLSLLVGSSLSAMAQKKPAAKAKTPAASAAIPAATLAAGKALYAQNCLVCHQADGGGVERMNAPLTKTSWVLGDKTRLVNVLLNGMQGVEIDGEVYTNVMPAFTQLSDQQLAEVLTYIRNSFGNKASAVSSAEVKAVRAANKK
jgi:mono/diheme cytochrome c family protein